MKCDRCGIDNGTILNLGTGSSCHPAPITCISLLKGEIKRLKELLEKERQKGQMRQ